jgi:hypothetical protein
VSPRKKPAGSSEAVATNPPPPASCRSNRACPVLGKLARAASACKPVGVAWIFDRPSGETKGETAMRSVNAGDTASAADPARRAAKKRLRSDFSIACGGWGAYVPPPTQQRTCLWPSWLRNDVKRSGNRLVAGSFDRFVNYAHRLDRWALHRGCGCDESENRPIPC